MSLTTVIGAATAVRAVDLTALEEGRLDEAKKEPVPNWRGHKVGPNLSRIGIIAMIIGVALFVLGLSNLNPYIIAGGGCAMGIGGGCLAWRGMQLDKAINRVHDAADKLEKQVSGLEEIAKSLQDIGRHQVSEFERVGDEHEADLERINADLARERGQREGAIQKLTDASEFLGTSIDDLAEWKEEHGSLLMALQVTQQSLRTTQQSLALLNTQLETQARRLEEANTEAAAFAGERAELLGRQAESQKNLEDFERKFSALLDAAQDAKVSSDEVQRRVLALKAAQHWRRASVSGASLADLEAADKV
jgi:DNA repair exonuclease SbcCD ATPase subunit